MRLGLGLEVEAKRRESVGVADVRVRARLG